MLKSALLQTLLPLHLVVFADDDNGPRFEREVRLRRVSQGPTYSATKCEGWFLCAATTRFTGWFIFCQQEERSVSPCVTDAQSQSLTFPYQLPLTRMGLFEISHGLKDLPCYQCRTFFQQHRMSLTCGCPRKKRLTTCAQTELALTRMRMFLQLYRSYHRGRR